MTARVITIRQSTTVTWYDDNGVPGLKEEHEVKFPDNPDGTNDRMLYGIVHVSSHIPADRLTDVAIIEVRGLLRDLRPHEERRQQTIIKAVATAATASA